MAASFVGQKELDLRYDIPLEANVIVGGNSDVVEMPISNKYVSRRHFQVRQETDVYYISDLGSTNGTYLNGERLEPGKEHILRDEDIVTLGDGQVVLVFSGPPRTLLLDPPRAESKDLVVDARSRDVWVKGKKLGPALSRKEFDILECLYRDRGKAVSRDEIGTAGWPERGDGSVAPEEIDQYIKRLRRRIEQDPAHPKIIVTRINYGYLIP